MILRRAYRPVRSTIYKMLNALSPSTASEVHHREVQLKTRLRKRWGAETWMPEADKIHLGCGARKVEGWLNVDIGGGDVNLDLAAGYLPWQDSSFSAAVSKTASRGGLPGKRGGSAEAFRRVSPSP